METKTSFTINDFISFGITLFIAFIILIINSDIILLIYNWALSLIEDVKYFSIETQALFITLLILTISMFIFNKIIEKFLQVLKKKNNN
ncbi:hypothetical protein IQ37_17255 [Chryseobacterium piperi]|uniref:Uncharacterized protein n=1 Tax=Chryseobacterium piperi TaxID=558152 RepID=A0A086AKL7_9FLAO|nr:hypothetical protein [Chryseobacterium piperi]ASW75971.1 hypothetical protein CJF12_17985 [Chryseobacterium piperi]KFF17231.1 hypothetical protein IQ37_17255 [Chryseobacterium piperi]